MRHYQANSIRHFETVCDVIRHDLLFSSIEVAGKTWQSQDVSQRPEMVTMEMLHASLELDISGSILELVKGISPNLPWADDHFAERVGGQPLNPPPSEAWWPYAQQGNSAHKEGQQFSHTYPERMWPKHAGHHSYTCEPFDDRRGVRFNYGDLGDVVDQLRRDPTTRQAYLPIWFPEDTGAVQGQRVPCTLGYRFIYRNRLDITYDIRSCDFIRHFRDDVYMAARLCHWVADMVTEFQPSNVHPSQWVTMKPGRLIMNITSLHAFAGDRPGMLALDAHAPVRASQRLIESLS